MSATHSIHTAARPEPNRPRPHTVHSGSICGRHSAATLVHITAPAPTTLSHVPTRETPTVNAGKTPPTDPLTDTERRTARRLAVTVGVVLTLAAVAVAFGESTSRPAQSDGACITVSVASSMGGGVEHACGVSARNTCQTARHQQDTHSIAVRKACDDAHVWP